VFKEVPGHTWTEMERWVCHEAKEWYEEMIEYW
jgi:hypothetical protein